MSHLSEAKSVLTAHVAALHPESVDWLLDPADDQSEFNREAKHDIMHTRGMLRQHKHADDGSVILPDGTRVSPITTRRMRKALNVHMNWSHGKAPVESHEAAHKHDENTHTHEWPLDVEVLEAYNERVKAQKRGPQ